MMQTIGDDAGTGRELENVLPPELALVAACCTWPHTPSNLARVADLAARVADWGRFEHLIGVHRIAPLAHAALAKCGAAVPEAVSARLRQRALNATRRDLAMARETLALQRAFDDAGLPMLVLKGAALGMLAYGRPGLKQSWDIDLLVLEGQIAEAHGLLSAMGYRRELNDAQAAAVTPIEHEILYNGPGGTTIEVHTRPCHSRSMLAGVDATGPMQTVVLTGGNVRTLADEPLFAFLCLHAAAHHWCRLKWLADIGAFVAGRPDRMPAIIAAAAQYGAGRSASVALALGRDLLGIELSPEVEALIEDSAATRALCADVLASGYFRGTDHRLSWRTRWLLLRMEPGARHVLGRMARALDSPADRAMLPLPRALSFAYPLMRVPTALWRAAGRRRTHRRAH
jgi:hypothetical protein